VILALSLLVSTALAAAPPNLGPEIPVGDPDFFNATLTQQVASVASNGRDYLVLWNDARVPVGTSLALYAGRVDASGHPVELSGHKVVDGATGKLLWTGTSYALLYNVGGISFLQLLDDNGYPTSPAIHLELGGPAFAAGTNGSNFLSVDLSGAIFLINFNGGVFRQHISHPLGGVSQVAALPGGDYFFAAIESDCPQACSQRIVLEQADRLTAAITRHPLLDVGNGTQLNGAATDDGRMLVAWSDPADQLSVRYEIVDATGHVLAGPALLPNGTPFNGISVGWDGRDFLVAFAGQRWRIAANGQIFAHGTAAAGPLLFAHGVSGVLEARTAGTGNDTDVLVHAAPSFGSLVAASERSVAMSSPRQREPRLAASAAGFVAWFEKNASLMVQPLGGAVTHIADVVPWDSYFPPALAVARGGNGYLVAWQPGDRLAIYAKRLALDGTPLDAEPITLAATDEFQFDVAGTISIASDGTNFLVIWPALLGALHGVRISQGGTVLDDAPLVIAPPNPNFHAVATPRVVWTGKNYVVAWIDVQSCGCLISPAPPPRVRVFATRVDRDGRPLDAQPLALTDQTSIVSSLAVTTNGDGAALVWTGACVTAAALRADGTPAGAPRALTCRTTPPGFVNSFDDAAVTWSGSEYVAVWSDPAGRAIHAERLDEMLAPIDDFDVSPAGFAASQPDVAATANGVAIGYVRFAPEPQFGGAPRIFIRLLERLHTLPRHRASR
jgi:hypothetical protein